MQSKAQLWGFFKALVNFTLPSKASEPVPHTFLFDEDRIVKLRTDMLDAINLEICMALYRQLKAESIRFTRSGLIDSHEMQNERVYGLSASMDPSSRPTTPDRYVRSVPSSPDSSVSLASSRNSVRITSNCFSISSHEPSNELRTSLLDILASAFQIQTNGPPSRQHSHFRYSALHPLRSPSFPHLKAELPHTFQISHHQSIKKPKEWSHLNSILTSKCWWRRTCL